MFNLRSNLVGTRRSLTSGVLAALTIIVATTSGASGQILADPNKEYALQLFNSGDLRKSMPLLRKQHQDNPYDSTSAYLYAVSLHRLGYKALATHEYEQILSRFPRTDASRLSQTALAQLAPAFLSQWRAIHPNTDYVGTARPWDVAPDLGNPVNQLASQDSWIFDRHGASMVVDAFIAVGGCRAIIDPQANRSSMGRNTLKALGSPAINYDRGAADPIMKTTVSVGAVHRVSFPMHLVSSQTMPILGKDYLRGFAYRIDPKQSRIILVRKSDASADDIATGQSTMYKIRPETNGAMLQTATEQKWTEISISKVKDMFIGSVYVDGTQVAMQVNGSDSSCLFSTAQISAINSDYLNGGNSQQQLTGTTLTTTSSVLLRSVRLGPISANNVPAQIVDTSSARFQANQVGTSEYPVLGSAIWDGWDHVIDEKKMVIKVRKKQ